MGEGEYDLSVWPGLGLGVGRDLGGRFRFRVYGEGYGGIRFGVTLFVSLH